jgi:hypothetical protein
VEEPDLEKLFLNATEELTSSEFESDYGFQREWNDEEDDKSGAKTLQLGAAILLFDSMVDFPVHMEKIERFCLPLFAAARSDYAVDYVISVFPKSTPHPD